MIPTGAQPSRMRRFPTRCWISNLTRSTSSLNQRARKGAAPGPSGLTAEVARVLLDDEGASDLFVRVTQLVAQAAVPRDAARALGLGRMVALQKPNGRVRGIVIGDFTRRLVARCFAQQKAEAFQEACSPFQFALSTRSGAESVVRLLTAALELDPESTLVSVDGVGAFDTMSRQAMLQGLLRVPGANQCLPFVRMFYSEPSEYVWHDADGTAHIIQQAEGGEQGDPLMPALYSLGQHGALEAVHAQMQPNELLVAFLDDVITIARPDRVGLAHQHLADELWTHCRVRLNSGKTRIWNLSGRVPPALGQPGAPEASCWVGAGARPVEEQGLTVLGVPVGSAAFVRSQLLQSRAGHDRLLERLPALGDLQASWLLLLFCCSPRCNYLLRMLAPATTAEYAQDHDSAVLSALSTLLGTGDLPRHARDVAQLPLSLGGLGLASAVRNSVPAFWASWADCLAVLSRCLPRVAQEFLDHLDSPDPQPACFAAAAAARAALGHSDWAPPAWRELSAGESAPVVQEEGPSTFLRGWQGQAAAAEARRHRETLLAGADPAAQALLHSQSGPFASRFLTTVPVSSVLSYPCHLFRVLLLRRLRLPLPLAERTCRCRRLLDPFGDHRAACARSGVLRGRGCPLERAAARVCREAGARVTSNTRLADLNLQVDRVDDRRLEVVANGLPLWGGQQLAVDTTLVSPLSGQGQPVRRGGQVAGAALAVARRRKERAYPELVRAHRCRLVVLAVEVGGRWSDEAASFIRSLARARALEAPARLRPSVVSALVARWSAQLTHAAMTAFASSLFRQAAGPELCNAGGGTLPPLGTLLADLAHVPLAGASRLPSR